MSSNYYESWTYTLGASTTNSIFSNLSVLKTPTSALEGVELLKNPIYAEPTSNSYANHNFRKIVITLAAPAVEDEEYIIRGYIYNGTIVEESVFILAGSSTANSSYYYSELLSIKAFPNSVDWTGISFGIQGGYTPWVLSNSAKTTHMAFFQPALAATFTVYGRISQLMNKDVNALKLREFPIDANLNAITANPAYPIYNQLGIGMLRGFVADGSTGYVTWQAGLQMWL
jgi:hypothetical protein